MCVRVGSGGRGGGDEKMGKEIVLMLVIAVMAVSAPSTDINQTVQIKSTTQCACVYVRG